MMMPLCCSRALGEGGGLGFGGRGVGQHLINSWECFEVTPERHSG